jgi:hypothetical protein
MLARKDQDQEGKALSEEWNTKVLGLLNSVYEAQCKQREKAFYVYGEFYPNELVVAVSLVDQNDQISIPITYLISIDIKTNDKVEQLLGNLVDSVGIFFDTFFAESEWNDYQAKWQEADFKKLKFHYKVTRENIELTLAANKLLKD